MQKRVFQNNILETLTRTSPAIVWGFFIPYCSLFIAYDFYHGRATTESILLFLAALPFWTLCEYVLHRYAFHFENDNPIVKKIHYFAHGYHHENPKDKNHLFMPIPTAVPLSLLFFGLFYLVLGQRAFSFFPGFMIGYLIYASMHYAMHTIPQPPKFLRPLWRHHYLHHYKYPNKAYGVSSIFWDLVFGTMPPLKEPQNKNI